MRRRQLKEKHEWSDEKPKLDNARWLRGIYIIDPEDKEFKETIRNANKNLETSMAPAMPCKTCKKSEKGETRGKTNEIKSKLVYFGSQWIHKTAYGRLSTELPWGPYCRKGRQFSTALQFGSQIYSYASSYENSGSKSIGGQGMGKIGENFGVELDKSPK